MPMCHRCRSFIDVVHSIGVVFNGENSFICWLIVFNIWRNMSFYCMNKVFVVVVVVVFYCIESILNHKEHQNKRQTSAYSEIGTLLMTRTLNVPKTCLCCIDQFNYAIMAFFPSILIVINFD